ncbi:hypothetical protein [Actinomadura terrae]|uniref:hypothetical protein n=1 Tax=Actinomadura terrae TaxID=604353 RepID=UPI001FA7A7B6|nr:hypothetical protein [Actinomadura terrae]
MVSQRNGGERPAASRPVAAGLPSADPAADRSDPDHGQRQDGADDHDHRQHAQGVPPAQMGDQDGGEGQEQRTREPAENGHDE